MIQAFLWIIIKAIDYLQTYLDVSKFGWSSEANPLFVYSYGKLGWIGLYIGTVVIGLSIWLSLVVSKYLGKKVYKIINIYTWVFIFINFLNIFRNLLIDINFYPSIFQ